MMYLTQCGMYWLVTGYSGVPYYLSKWSLEQFDLENSGQAQGLEHSQWSHNSNIYKRDHWAFFSLALTVFKIFTFKNSWHWKCRSWSWHKIFVVAPFDGECLTSNLMAIVMFALSLLVYEILEKRQNFDLQNEGKCQEAELRDTPFDWKCSYIGELFRIIAIWQQMFTQKDAST